MTTVSPATDHVLRERLLAILAADVAGYSRLMSLDDRATVAALDAARALFREQVAGHGGRVIDMAGDSVLAVFDTVTGAVDAALAVQRMIAAADGATAEDRRMRFRIGIHVGDVIEKADGTVYGDGVNIAARLEGLADPGSLAVSQAVHGMVARRVNVAFDDIGEQTVKNIAQPVRVYRLRNRALHFGRYELQFSERRLLVDGKPAALPARALALLIALAEQRGQLIGKQALVERAWPGVALEDTDIAPQIHALRELFGGEIVVTVPGRGYRFTPAADAGVPATRPMPEAAVAASPLAQAPAMRTNLPAELPTLLGRADDLAALATLIEQHRLVTIVGAGGMGKTRLAQTLLAARRNAYAHGVCWVEMASITDAALLPGCIAAALGVKLGSGDPGQGLLAALAPLTLLVALDNAEQLLADVSRLAGELHDAAPGLRLVVTSQAPLKLAAERVYRIGALAVPQGALPAAQALDFGAVALFTERARAADARFVLTDANAPAAIDLCRALDGLALAIELAAARAPMLGVQRLASSMQDRLKLLTTSRNRAAPARQQTLRAALDWSHGLLDAREQAVFRRLGVIAGSASLELIQQVVADPPGEGELDEWAVLDALSLLIDRSLVTVLTSDDESEVRYRLLESPRAYALERLAAAGEQEALQRRHALAMATLFDAAWDECFSGSIGALDWMRRLGADLDNAREALAWATAAGDPSSALAIGITLLRALPWSMYAERMALAERCEALVGPTIPEVLQWRAWIQLSVQWGHAHRQRSHAAAQRALGLARALSARKPDAFMVYLSLCRLARNAMNVGEADVAATALAELYALVDPDWPAQRLYLGVEIQAHVAGLQGNAADALRHARRLVVLDRARGAGSINTLTLVGLIDLELAAGDAASAARTGTDLVTVLEGTRDEFTLAYARLNLAGAWLALDDCTQARRVAQAGWPQAARFELQPYWADYLALLAALEARVHAAARLVGYADAGYAARDETRDPNEAAAVARVATLTRAALGAAEFDRAHAEGTALRSADIAALAFGLEDA